jgi:hypothetical protein
LASWTATPPSVPSLSANGVWNEWTFWQYSDSGSVPGIAGAVDLDVYRGTRERFYQNFVVGAVPEPSAGLMCVLAAGILLVRTRRLRISPGGAA